MVSDKRFGWRLFLFGLHGRNTRASRAAPRRASSLCGWRSINRSDCTEQAHAPHGPRQPRCAPHLWQTSRQPRASLPSAHAQSILIIQPPDRLPDGRQNMCDGCPDGFHYKGRFIW